MLYMENTEQRGTGIENESECSNFRSDQSSREKWSTSKGGLTFSKLLRLDGTDPFSFRPKFQEILVEWIAPWVLFIMPKVPEISARSQIEKTISLRSDRNIRDHLWRWSIYFGRNIPTEICSSIVTNRFIALFLFTYVENSEKE